MASENRGAMIRAIFSAYMTNDRKVVEDSLADDFRFTSPYDDRIDKASYFARCWKNSDWIERHELERIFIDDDEAFVTYKCTARGGKSFRNTEFFVFSGDKVSRIDVYFGATYQNGVFLKQAEIKIRPACRFDRVSFVSQPNRRCLISNVSRHWPGHDLQNNCFRHVGAAKPGSSYGGAPASTIGPQHMRSNGE
jgi:ketosteroid isomerase-like protein